MGNTEQGEFEAFILKRACQFTGAFCNSLHCDEMGYSVAALCIRLGWVREKYKNRQNSTNGNKKKTKKHRFYRRGAAGKYFTGHQRLSLYEDGLRTVCAVPVAGSRDHTISNWLAEETIQTLWKKIFGIFGELWVFWKYLTRECYLPAESERRTFSIWMQRKTAIIKKISNINRK